MATYSYYGYVNFDFNADKLNAKGQQKLMDQLAKINAAKGQIALSGFADPKGNAAYNKALSKRRVENVFELLKSKGIEASRMSQDYFGEEQLRVPESYPNSDASNRRVEIRIK